MIKCNYILLLTQLLSYWIMLGKVINYRFVIFFFNNLFALNIIIDIITELYYEWVVFSLVSFMKTALEKYYLSCLKTQTKKVSKKCNNYLYKLLYVDNQRNNQLNTHH